MRYCFDSITARDIPADAAIVAGYIDGIYRWSDADWTLFPSAVKVRIAVRSWTNDGHVLDVERGDAEPWEAPDWCLMRRAAGVDPTIYCGIYQWDAVRHAFATSKVAEPHYWIAHYDNDPTPLAGAVAKQYANATFTGGHYDASIVDGRWPGVEGDDDLAFATDPDAQAFKNDINNSIQAIKEDLKALHAGIAALGSAEVASPHTLIDIAATATPPPGYHWVGTKLVPN